MARRKQTPAPFGEHYLRFAHIDAYGAFSQRKLGPFDPGLNVVYGPNEAGKTTASSFIGGVLFGWEDARGQRNTYKPSNAERSGTLLFSPRSPESAATDISCTRVKNAEGIKPDPEPSVLADIDKQTFATIFSLNSDELLGLGNASDVTAHLLTAGAGTAISPARALEQVDDSLKKLMSTSRDYPDSIPNLRAELDRTQAAIDAAAEEAVQFKQEAREYADLSPQLEEAGVQLASLNAEVELLVAQTAAIEHGLALRTRLAEENEQLLAREAELAAREEHQAGPADSLSAIDDARMRSLREDLDELSLQQARVVEDLEQAEDEYAAAKASFAAIAKDGSRQKVQAAEQRRARLLSALAFALPAIFVVAAVAMFVLSRDSESSVPFVLTIVFALAALVFGGLGPFLLSRQGANVSIEQQRFDDATRRLTEAERHLASAQEKSESQASRVAQKLQDAGLGAAGGDIRYARELLDDAREARSAAGLLDQQRASIAASRAALDASIKRNADEIDAAYNALGVETDTPLQALQSRLDEKTQTRNTLQVRTAQMNERFGKLGVELARAEHLRSFDQAKLDYAQLSTRMEESKEDYARLLLVRRLLEVSVAAWEDKSQPAVYQKASDLLSSMTDGAWTRVSPGESGAIVVADAFGQERAPLLLSTGTRQQLYLALRIALLMTAENVGRSLPILADDILVNFDNDRRKGAARALWELSRVRQVVMFTCHEEVVRLMQEECPDLNLVEL